MKNLKAAQKHQTICEFGILIGPIVDAVEAAPPPTADAYRIAIAKVQAGDAAWRQGVRELTSFAPDVLFNQEYQDISHVPERCLGALKDIVNDPQLMQDPSKLQVRAAQEVEGARERFFELIERVPITWEPVVFEANTPFTAYLRINEALASAKRRLHYFDRYLKPDFFPLFLAALDRSVSVRLVTTAGNASYGVASVTALAQIAQQEFADFELMEVSPGDVHDRNLRVDDQVFTLGPGVDRAGIALTNFGPADSTPEAHAEFDRVIGSGRIVT